MIGSGTGQVALKLPLPGELFYPVNGVTSDEQFICVGQAK